MCTGKSACAIGVTNFGIVINELSLPCAILISYEPPFKRCQLFNARHVEIMVHVVGN